MTTLIREISRTQSRIEELKKIPVFDMTTHSGHSPYLNDKSSSLRYSRSSGGKNYFLPQTSRRRRTLLHPLTILVPGSQESVNVRKRRRRNGTERYDSQSHLRRWEILWFSFHPIRHHPLLRPMKLRQMRRR